MVQCSELCSFSILWNTTASRVWGIELQKACRSQIFGNPLSEHACRPWTEKAFRLRVTYAWTFRRGGPRLCQNMNNNKQDWKKKQCPCSNMEMSTVRICRRDLQSSVSPTNATNTNKTLKYNQHWLPKVRYPHNSRTYKQGPNGWVVRNIQASNPPSREDKFRSRTWCD